MKKLLFILLLSTVLYGQGSETVIYTENFTGNTIDTSKWNRAYYGVYTPSLDTRFFFLNDKAWAPSQTILESTWQKGSIISKPSVTTGDIDFRGKFWKATSPSGNGSQVGMFVAPENSTVTYIRIGDGVYADGLIGVNIKRNGVTIYDEFFAGLSLTDSSRVYRITYTRATNEVKFYYKASDATPNWTQLGITKTCDLSGLKLVAGIFNSDIGFSNRPAHRLDDLWLQYDRPITFVPTMQITSPDSVNVGRKTYVFNWTSNVDTARIYRNDTLLTTIYTARTWTWLSDSTAQYTGNQVIKIKGIYRGLEAVQDQVVMYFPNDSGQGVIRPITTSIPNIVFKDNSTPVTINLQFGTYAIDSVRMYYRLNTNEDWRFIKKVYITRDTIEVISNTSFSFQPTRESGRLYIRLEEDKDTTKYGLTLRNYLNVRLVPPPKVGGVYAYGGCFQWGLGADGFYANHDYTCGWVASYHGRVQTRIKVYLNKVNPANYQDAREWVVWTDTTNTEQTNLPNTAQYDSTWAAGHSASITPATPSITHKGRIYRYTGNGTITMEDPVNGVQYQVFSYGSDPSNTFDFTNMNFMLSADGNGFILYNASSSMQGFRVNGVTTYIRMFNGRPNGMVFGGLPEPTTGFAFAEFSLTGGTVTSVSNKFRGIHPKIWKYGRADGVKQ